MFDKIKEKFKQTGNDGSAMLGNLILPLVPKMLDYVMTKKNVHFIAHSVEKKLTGFEMQPGEIPRAAYTMYTFTDAEGQLQIKFQIVSLSQMETTDGKMKPIINRTLENMDLREFIKQFFPEHKINTENNPENNSELITDNNS